MPDEKKKVEVVLWSPSGISRSWTNLPPRMIYRKAYSPIAGCLHYNLLRSAFAVSAEKMLRKLNSGTPLTLYPKDLAIKSKVNQAAINIQDLEIPVKCRSLPLLCATYFTDLQALRVELLPKTDNELPVKPTSFPNQQAIKNI